MSGRRVGPATSPSGPRPIRLAPVSDAKNPSAADAADDLPEQLRGDEAIEGRMQTWAVLGRGTLAGGGLPVLWLCRDGEESR